MDPLPPPGPDPVDLDRLRTYSISERAHKVNRDQLGRAVEPSVPVGEFLDSLPGTLGVQRLRDLADRIAQGPRVAQGVIRDMVAGAFEATEAAQLDTERNAMARASGGDEAAEGIAAFLEKRKPNFST